MAQSDISSHHGNDVPLAPDASRQRNGSPMATGTVVWRIAMEALPAISSIFISAMMRLLHEWLWISPAQATAGSASPHNVPRTATVKERN